MAAMQKIHPRAYHLRFLEQKCRPDGRGLDTCRPTTITQGNLDHADGSSMVKIGHTTVICSVSLEIGSPFAVAPKNGRLDVALHLPPLCSSRFTYGKTSPESVAVAQFVANVVLSTRAIELSELCVETGKAVWVIYADVVCLNCDGNLRDASLLAVLAALRDLRLPAVRLNDQGRVEYVESYQQQLARRQQRRQQALEAGSVGSGSTLPGASASGVWAGRSLQVHHIPLPTSFAQIEGHVVADPSADEEELMSAGWTIAFNQRGELCTMHKPGGNALSTQELTRCAKLAQARAKQLATLFPTA
eukprot:g41932.t1